MVSIDQIESGFSGTRNAAICGESEILYCMNLDEVISTLRAERDRIDAALQALTGEATTAIAPAKKKPGRPPKPTTAPLAKKKKRKLTPEGRARIAEAVRRRWAAQKKAGK